MPTVKTVKPDGTGDFTTLAAWQTFAAAQVTADQWAECYGGGNLGAVVLTGWTATPLPIAHPRIYAHSSARHNGQLNAFPPATAAYVLLAASANRVSWAIPYVEIDGLVVYKTATGNATTAGTGGNKYTVKNCLFARPSGPVGACFTDGNTTSPQPGATYFYNNICYIGAGTTSNSPVAVSLTDCGGLDTVYCLNNTTITNGHAVTGIQIDFLNPLGAVIGNAVYGINSAGGQLSIFDTNDAGGGEHEAAYSHNATEDGQSTRYGDPAEQVFSGSPFASATDPTPATGSILIDTSVSTATYGVTTDVIGTTRPQGSAYDIGAFEYIPAGGGSGRRRRHSSSIRL